jgi:hypothetical protein
LKREVAAFRKKHRTTTLSLTASMQYMPPHTMPNYGGKCFLTIYDENAAWMRLAQAMQTYQQKWQASENCLNGTVA